MLIGKREEVGEMSARKLRKAGKRVVEPGDHVHVRFGLRIFDGIATSAHDDLIHVTFNIEGSDEPVLGLYRESELVA